MPQKKPIPDFVEHLDEAAYNAHKALQEAGIEHAFHGDYQMALLSGRETLRHDNQVDVVVATRDKRKWWKYNRSRVDASHNDKVEEGVKGLEKFFGFAEKPSELFKGNDWVLKDSSEDSNEDMLTVTYFPRNVDIVILKRDKLPYPTQRRGDMVAQKLFHPVSPEKDSMVFFTITSLLISKIKCCVERTETADADQVVSLDLKCSKSIDYKVIRKEVSNADATKAAKNHPELSLKGTLSRMGFPII